MGPLRHLVTVASPADVAGVCEVRLEHGGWGPGNAAARAAYHRWPELLSRYALACVRAAD